jgi:hypothetical protein
VSTTPFTDALEEYLRARENYAETTAAVTVALETCEPYEQVDGELVNAEEHAEKALARARDRLESLYAEALHMGRQAL